MHLKGSQHTKMERAYNLLQALTCHGIKLNDTNGGKDPRDFVICGQDRFVKHGNIKK